MILAGVSLLLTLAVIESIYRHFRVAAEYTRKLAHVGCGYLVWYWSARISFTEYCILLTVFLGLFLLEKRLNVLRSLHCINRPSIGDITYLAGLYVLGVVFYGTPLFTPGLLIMVIPDAAAGAITFTREQTEKDWVHSSVMFACSMVLLVSMMPVGATFAVAAAVTAAERFSPYGLDNVMIPMTYILMIKVVNSAIFLLGS